MADLDPKAYISSDINNILQSVTDPTLGVALANRFQVLITTPDYKQSGMSQEPEYLRHISLRCESITLAGRSLATYPYRIYGPARNIPYEVIYAGELQATFLLDKNLFIKTQFEEWMNMICMPPSYKLEFYENYAGMIEITLLDKEDTPKVNFEFYGVYPKLVGDIQLGNDKDNEALRLDVTFCYRKYQLINQS